jgi:hypothetical protein
MTMVDIDIVAGNPAVHCGKVYVYAASEDAGRPPGDHVGLTPDQARAFAVKLIEAAAVANTDGDWGTFGWAMTLGPP